MANRKWNGGTTAVAQVDSFTPGGTIEVGDKFIITLTAEDGSTTQTVSADATGTSVAQVCTDVHTAVTASNQTLFAALTWADNTTNVSATADVAGVPFYAAASTTESDDGAADAQTFARAAVTASAGPLDWNTTGNWSGATLPVDSDNVLVTESAYSILYGLEQSDIQLASLSVNQTFSGSIGDAVNGYSLIIDSTITRIQSAGPTVMLDGDLDSVYVMQSAGGTDAVVLDGDIDDLYVSGQGVIGQIRVAGSAVLDNVYVLEADRCKVTIGTGVTSLDLVEADSGEVECDSAGAVVNAVSGARVKLTTGAWTTVNARRGSVVDYRTDGTLTNANVFGGVIDLTKNTAASVTITNTTVHGGSIDVRNGLNNITFTNSPDVKGGAVVSDVGVTVNPKE